MPVSELPPSPTRTTTTAVEVQFEVEPGLQADWDRPRIEQLVRSIVGRELPPGRYSISLYLAGDETLRALNRDHRGLDQHTDVLSFPLHDPTGMQFVLPPDHAANLGDVVISYPRVLAQAEAYDHSPDRELAYLTAHGLLHLLGYDHEQELERRRMRAREEEALAPLGFTR
jgi:probable rRNA maturation factor